jgi:hypothetical protein
MLPGGAFAPGGGAVDMLRRALWGTPTSRPLKAKTMPKRARYKKAEM